MYSKINLFQFLATKIHNKVNKTIEWCDGIHCFVRLCYISFNKCHFFGFIKNRIVA